MLRLNGAVMVCEGDTGERQVEDDLPRPFSGHLEGMLNDLALGEDGEATDAKVKDDHEVFLSIM